MIENYIFDYIKNKNILVSVSGGVDSIVLLDILNKNKEKYNYNLEIFHFNHQTRMSLSNKDEEFVSNLAKKLGLNYHTETYSMERYAKELNLSEEEAGRILRKNAISNILDEKTDIKDWIIALGHNLDDQIETVLMRIIRGTGIDGIVGMQIYDENTIRPLLETSKNDIIEYALKNNLEYRDDHTNFENDYRRNSIRNELIPFIKEKYNTNIYSSISNLSKLALEERKYIDKNIDELIDSVISYRKKSKTVFKKADLLKLSEFELIEIIRREITRINKSTYNFEKIHYKEIIDIIFSRNAFIKTFNNLVFYNSYDDFIISKEIKNELIDGVEINLDSNKECIFNGFGININDNEGIYLPKDSKVIIRTRKNGDRLLIKNKEKKIKDFFIDKKVDRYIRDYLPIIEYDGEIIIIADIYTRDLGYKDGIRINVKGMKENYE